MAKSRSGNGWLWALGIGVGLLLAGSAAKKVGDVNGDGSQDINDVVTWLNNRFGKQWVSLGINALLAAAPSPYNVLLPLVFQVEQEYLGRKGASQAKKQRAQALRQRA